MSCKTLQRTSVEKLISAGFLTENLKVKNLEKVQEENQALRLKFKKLYNKDIPDALGYIKNNELVLTTTTDNFEELLQEDGRKLYGDIGMKPITVYDNIQVKLSPTELVKILKYKTGDIYFPTREGKEGDWGHNISLDTLYENMVLNFDTDKLNKFLGDLRDGKNLPKMVAVFPTLMKPVLASIETARTVEANLQSSFDRKSGKVVFEELIEQRGGENLKIINDMFNQVLEDTNTDFTVSINRGSLKSVQGSASTSHINIEAFNIALNNTTRPEMLRDFMYTYLHEKAHILTISFLNDKEYAKKIEELYKFSISKTDVTAYGFKNVYEFLAEGMSNPEFQKVLSEIPYNHEKSLFDKLIDTFLEQLEKVLGVKVNGTVLGELMDATNIVAKKFSTEKIKLHDVDNSGIFYDVSSTGAYVGNANVVDVYDFADKNHFFYDAFENQFYTGNPLNPIKLDKHAMSHSMDFNKEKYYYKDKRGPQANSFEQVLEREGIKNMVDNPYILYKEYDPKNINGNLDALLEINRTSVVGANESEDNLYSVLNQKFYRTGAYLNGQEVDKLNPLVQNAIKIGNIADEAAKRIFRGDNYKDYTWEKVSKFVKDEERKLIIEEGSIPLKFWEANYKNPVQKDSYNELVAALEKMKENLLKTTDISKFHTDVVVWDYDKLVAGEIDILAQHKDGSLTVIDMKTRRSGYDETYDATEIDTFNTKSKHTRQTGLYSNMLDKMGFKTRDPKILMAQPEYTEEPADNQVFQDILPDEKLMLIDLDKITDFFNFKDKEGLENRKLRNKVRYNTQAYRKWFRLRKSLVAPIGFIANRDSQLETLNEELDNLRKKISEYKNILDRSHLKGTITKELSELEDQLVQELDKAFKETYVDEKLLIIKDFFQFAYEQMRLLSNELDDPNLSEFEEARNTYFKINNYIGVFKVAEDIYTTLEKLAPSFNIDKEEYDKIKEQYKQFQDLNADLKINLKIKVKNLAREALVQTYLGSKFEIKVNNTLRKEAEAEFGNDQEKIEDFLNKKRRDPAMQKILRTEYAKEIDELVDGISYDMSRLTYLFNSDVSINNDYVQLMHSMLGQAEQRFSTIANTEVLRLAKFKNKLKLSRREVEELIVTDKEGDSFLLSKWDIEFYNEIKRHQEAIREAEDQVATDEEERRTVLANISVAKKKYAKWKKDNIERSSDGFAYQPKAKWLSKEYQKLSQEQREAVNEFKRITLMSDKRIGRRSLRAKTFLPGITYFRLPGVKQTVFGGIIRGEGTASAKKLFDEWTKIEIDDIEEGKEADEYEDRRLSNVSLDGQPVYTVPIFFRGRPNPARNTGTQNKDLFSIYAMELQNGIRYEIDLETSMNATLIVDMVNNSKFYATIGTQKLKVGSIFAKKGDIIDTTIDGDASIVSKQLTKMLKNRMYSMTQEYAGEIKIPKFNGEYAKIDIHRAMQVVSSYTAFASMSFKLLSASNNWITGQTSIALEALGGEFYGKKNLINAKNFYWRNIGGILKDVGSPVKTNIVNQIMTRLDVQSERDVLNNKFERSNKFTQMLDPGMTLGGYSMGEHEIHGVLALAILDSTKVLDAKGNYLDKDGKIVKTKKEAASMLDTYYLNEEGILEQHKWAEYSTFETINDMNNGGESAIRLLIKDRVVRTQGAFGKDTQSEVNRLWYGKLFFQFKKHILPQTLNRFRGLGQFRKATDDPELENRNRKYYNYHAKTEEYGYYVSFFRHIGQLIKKEKFNILAYKQANKDEWKKMTKHERANINKTLAEFSYLTMVVLLAGMAAAAADEKDDKTLWAIAYLLRRQRGDSGGQYWNPADIWRITKSPLAAVRSLDTMSDAISQVTNPGEEFTTGINAGRNKLNVKLERLFLLDRLAQFEHSHNKRLGLKKPLSFLIGVFS